ncbi:MAG: putative toxin-antitoxin system toxin component, PIN family, partial [Candidatus Poribacteria bacterium]|nr:putative toxin-antitoxin system toxin component, PIN family [Candidatus Poribacteria bacterium]
ILEIERAGHIRLFTNEPLLAELARVVSRSKFFVQFKRVGTSADLLLSAYRKSAVVVEPAAIKPTVRADPTDDAVLACAKAADANFIVSGDDHLLSLREFDGIRIHDAAELVALFP